VKKGLAIWLILAASADAQITTSRPLRYCYVEATNVSNSDELRSHWESVWGSYDREHLHRMALKIRVGTTEDTGGRVTLNWFWLGRRQVDNALVVYGGGTKELTIPRAYFTELYTLAPQIRQRDQNFVLAGAHYVTGARHEGWIVSVRDSRNHLLAAKASSEPMLQLFRNEAEFDKLLFPTRARDSSGGDKQDQSAPAGRFGHGYN
jgi:hypothetical protein